jgi:hypothetical protein
MSDKRREAQLIAASRPRPQLSPGTVEAPAPRPAAEDWEKEQDVIPWLRRLGFSANEARRAAVQCESIPDASLEERLRLALSCLRPPQRVQKGLMRPA